MPGGLLFPVIFFDLDFENCFNCGGAGFCSGTIVSINSAAGSLSVKFSALTWKNSFPDFTSAMMMFVCPMSSTLSPFLP